MRQHVALVGVQQVIGLHGPQTRREEERAGQHKWTCCCVVFHRSYVMTLRTRPCLLATVAAGVPTRLGLSTPWQRRGELHLVGGAIMTETPDDLLHRAISGDAEALTKLLEEHGPSVRRHVECNLDRVWRTAVDVDDVMQITYLEAFLRIRQFQTSGPGAFAAWLKRIAENNFRDALRELQRAKRPNPRRRAQPTPSDDSSLLLLEAVGFTSTTPSRDAARSEANRFLEAALQTLPADYETVVRRCDLAGEPVADVAATLGRSAGAVHMLRARAHDRLREALGTASQFFTRVG